MCKWELQTHTERSKNGTKEKETGSTVQRYGKEGKGVEKEGRSIYTTWRAKKSGNGGIRGGKWTWTENGRDAGLRKAGRSTRAGKEGIIIKRKMEAGMFWRNQIGVSRWS